MDKKIVATPIPPNQPEAPRKFLAGGRAMAHRCRYYHCHRCIQSACSLLASFA
jgi:hypothetical protein